MTDADERDLRELTDPERTYAWLDNTSAMEAAAFMRRMLDTIATLRRERDEARARIERDKDAYAVIRDAGMAEKERADAAVSAMTDADEREQALRERCAKSRETFGSAADHTSIQQRDVEHLLDTIATLRARLASAEADLTASLATKLRAQVEAHDRAINAEAAIATAREQLGAVRVEAESYVREIEVLKTQQVALLKRAQPIAWSIAESDAGDTIDHAMKAWARETLALCSALTAPAKETSRDE